MSVPEPARERERLAALSPYEALDAGVAPALDRLTSLAARFFRIPMVSVSLVGRDVQRFVSAFGFEGRETPREAAFAAHTIVGDGPLVVKDPQVDPRFAAHPQVVGPPEVRFYAGAPLRDPEGHNLGSFCLFDVAPRSFDADEQGALAEFAALAIEALQRHAAARALTETRATLDAVLAISGEAFVVADASGQVLRMNELAHALGRLGTVTAEPEVWRTYEGVFRADRVTPFEPAAHPLPRALRGQATEHVELFVKSSCAPEGKLFAGRGRPVRDPAGALLGAVVCLRDLTDLRRAEAQLEESATTDLVTGLPNGRGLRQRLDLLIAEGGRGRSFVVVRVDIDHFQSLKDEHGAETADELLTSIGAALAGRSRRTDLVTRYGRDEFCILLTDIDEYLALKVVEDLRATVAANLKPFRVTASLGIAAYSSELYSAERLLAAAEKALARAQAEGGNKVVMHGR